MSDQHKEWRQIHDEGNRAFNKLSFEDNVKNMNALCDLIEAAEKRAKWRMIIVMLFFGLIALIVIFTS